MVLAFDDRDLAEMRAAQADHFNDRCLRLTWVADGTDELNLPIEDWTAAEVLSCGFSSSRQREVMVGTEVVLSNGQLRLPIGTPVDHRDRFRITHRHGSAVAELDAVNVYEVLGAPNLGPSGVVLDLRLATDGRAEAEQESS